ncbi:hypothetical protein [Winogradskyella haliclonae]|uniref:Uncharacterized protein n=1 Tax=Winogradskyella haliclonae TaxID=2048558 RepID=A0ABQ2BUD9_9FLAO|nr:hypothetical protein [Winogradskyella haliclonae]GGI56091.1 hypothetical protein GCM10011444_04000 [Winogradskyella haliclonae]
MFDNFYISFLNYTKSKLGRKAMPVSLYYVNVVEIAFYGLITSFFAAFASQLNIGKISSEKAIILSVLCVFFIYLKNWMRYNGKRRNVLNAKSPKNNVQQWKLVMFPIACIVLTIIFYQAI